MTLSLANILSMIGDSLRDPRAFARTLISVGGDRTQHWQFLGLITVIGVIITNLSLQLADDGSAPSDPIMVVVEALILDRPLVHAMLQFSTLVVMVFALFWVGRAFKGGGDFASGILLIAWIEVVLTALRAAQVLIWFASPPLASMLGVASFVLFFWLLSNFVAELHGFSSLLGVFLGILATMLGFIVGLSLLLGFIGLSLSGAPV